MNNSLWYTFNVFRLKGLFLHFEFSVMKNSDTNERKEAIPGACQKKDLEDNCLSTSRVVAFKVI